ncbi:MAG TPA: hypothetical protein PL180_01760 [Spirochaetota bacterium]|nr:hypothetical protein [Spirochaetota bacterium]HRS76883.1 hypothetical protein [Spirochaetota bacterium]HRT74451.1 hypothetical protein [Spirochaetota bacterium]
MAVGVHDHFFIFRMDHVKKLHPAQVSGIIPQYLPMGGAHVGEVIITVDPAYEIDHVLGNAAVLFLAVAQFHFQCTPVQRGIDGGKKVLRVDRLDDIAVRIGLPRPRDRCHVGIAGEIHHRDIIGFHYYPGRLDAVHGPRHHDVHEDKVRPLRAALPEGLFGVFNQADDIVAETGKGGFQVHAYYCLILNDENAILFHSNSRNDRSQSFSARLSKDLF